MSVVREVGRDVLVQENSEEGGGDVVEGVVGGCSLYRVAAGQEVEIRGVRRDRRREVEKTGLQRDKG